MAITSGGSFLLVIEDYLLGSGHGSWESTSRKYALFTSASTPNFATHKDRADLTEASASTYTAGGNALVSPTLSVVGGRLVYSFDNPNWTAPAASSLAAEAGGVVEGNGTAANDEIFFLNWFGSTITVDNSEVFRVHLPSSGAWSTA